MSFTVKELVVKYRQVEVEAQPIGQIVNPSDAIPVLQELLGDNAQETAGILAFDPQNHLIGWKVMGVGTLDSVMCHPRDVFQALCLMNAARFCVAHNHPVGNNLPSLADIRMTFNLQEAGAVMGITLMEGFVVNGISAVGIMDFCLANSIHRKSTDSEINAKLTALGQDIESVFFEGKKHAVSFNDALSIVFQKSLGELIPALDCAKDVAPEDVPPFTGGAIL